MQCNSNGSLSHFACVNFLQLLYVFLFTWYQSHSGDWDLGHGKGWRSITEALW
jgi:hypothetical protein